MLTASAPGKLVVLGEYAVLESAPALVFAVNRRATVTLTREPNIAHSVAMGKDHRNHSAFSVLTSNEVSWPDDESKQQYGIFQSVWQVLQQENLLESLAKQGFHVNLDTDDFSDKIDGQLAKYGLGSSAALTTALFVALAGRAPGANEMSHWLTVIQTAHQAFQDGKGSGLDVAASLYGGAIGFKNIDGVPSAQHLPEPKELVLGVVWTGVPASTTDMLAGIERWKSSDQAAYASLMAAMAETATAAIEAYSASNTEKFLQIFETYGNQLRILGEYSGLDIFSQEHEAIRACADTLGIKYKTCGAGGGDIGIALSADPDEMKKFATKVTAGGFQYLDLAVDNQGVILK